MVGVQKMFITFFLFDEITNHENWPFIDKNLRSFRPSNLFWGKQTNWNLAKIAACASKVVFYGVKLEIFQARAKRHMHARVPRKYYQVSSLSFFHIYFV